MSTISNRDSDVVDPGSIDNAVAPSATDPPSVEPQPVVHTGVHGHPLLLPPPPDIFRIGFANVCGFQPFVQCNGNNKNCKCHDCSLRKFLVDNRFDIYGLIELNVNWSNVPPAHRLPHRTRKWFEALRLQTAVLKPSRRNSSFRQWGGVSLWSMCKSAHHVDFSRSGSDPVGRWAWTTYRGKGPKSLCVITAYRPCRNTMDSGSAWNQQHCHFVETDGTYVDPLVRFDDDLRWITFCRCASRLVSPLFSALMQMMI